MEGPIRTVKQSYFETHKTYDNNVDQLFEEKEVENRNVFLE